MRAAGWALLVLAAGCGAPAFEGPDASGIIEESDAGARPAGPDAWADRVVSFVPGEGAGYGQDRFPDVVLGPPRGGGAAAGAMDVLSLGRGGVIVLELVDLVAVDGDGPDLLVFENPFSGFFETGVVAASEDGVEWREWPCASGDDVGRFPGCAGVASVFQNGPATGPLDPAAAGGDAFDLAELGLARARFVRIRDSGANGYEGVSGGFDLDAVGVVHGAAP